MLRILCVMQMTVTNPCNTTNYEVLMRGKVIEQTKHYYIADFSKDAERLNIKDTIMERMSASKQNCEVLHGR